MGSGRERCRGGTDRGDGDDDLVRLQGRCGGARPPRRQREPHRRAQHVARGLERCRRQRQAHPGVPGEARVEFPAFAGTPEAAMGTDRDIVATLEKVTTATLTTLLLKKNLRNVWMRGTRPISPGQPRLVGKAVTLRFLPPPEDLATPKTWPQPTPA